MRLVCLLVLLAVSAPAANVKLWQLEELLAAPVLVTGSVERIDCGPARPPGRWSTETRDCTVYLRVLRAHPSVGASLIRIPHVCYGPGARVSAGPIFPNIIERKTYVFPLRRDAGGWRMIADEGFDLLLPAVEPARPAWDSQQGFVIGELANTLLRGSYEDLYRAGAYFSMQLAVPRELLDELDRALPRRSPRWREITRALRAAGGPNPRFALAALVQFTSAR